MNIAGLIDDMTIQTDEVLFDGPPSMLWDIFYPLLITVVEKDLKAGIHFYECSSFFIVDINNL